MPATMMSMSDHNAASNVTILLRFIGDDLLGGAQDLNATTPLLALGVIDSLSMVSVMTFIRERFGVEVPNDSVTVSNFETVEAIAAMVERLVYSKSSH